MIKITVASYNNEAPIQPLSAVFGPEGNTLGRSDDNHFVLPDPKRYMSRLQASIRSDGARHLITNLSQANPILVSGKEISSSQEFDLKIGDEIQIGLYLLRVEAVDIVTGTSVVTAPDTALLKGLNPAPPSFATDNADSLNRGLSDTPVMSSGPFADLLGSTASAPLPGAAAPTSVELFLPPHDSANQPVATAPQHGGFISFDDLLNGSSHNAVVSERSTSVIPEDFNPFELPSQSSRNTADPLGDLSSHSEVTLESLEHNSEVEDLLLSAMNSPGGPLLDGSNFGTETQISLDPMTLFDSASVLPSTQNDGFSGQVMSNHTPEVNAYFKLPQASRETAHRFQDDGALFAGIDESQLSAPPAAAPTPPPTATAAMVHAATSDINDIFGIDAVSEAKELFPLNSLSAPIAPVVPMAANQTPAPALQQNDDVLLKAFLKGAGIPDVAIAAGLTPELMETIGKLLGTAVQGTVELIASRKVVKREVKADVTMIVVKNNNPLKFLPDGETALMQMFGKKMPGFMAPVDAMQDAYEDLRAHQIGVVAGMRAALDEVLNRFDPKQLTERLQEKSFLDSLMPANRKAKMWDLYTSLFQDIYLEAQDDFQALFGKAFLAAYENEIERFKNGVVHE